MTVTPQIHLHCALSSVPPQTSSEGDLFVQIAAAGFGGVECAPPPLLEASDFKAALEAVGLRFGAAVYLSESEDPEPIFERAAAVGAQYLEGQIDGYWQTDAWIDARIRQLIRLSQQYSVPFYLETHRGRYTQDLRRTLELLERHPNLLLCGDFSHYTVSGEIVAPWTGAWRKGLYQVAEKCAVIHARMNAGQRVQDPLLAVPLTQQQEFLELWAFAARAAVKRGQPSFTLATELLPTDYQYCDEHGVPVGDVWQDSLELREKIAYYLQPSLLG